MEREIAFSTVAFGLVIVFMIMGTAVKEGRFQQTCNVPVPVREVVEARDTLSAWQELIMAISYTESRWNPEAVGKNQDSGCLQIVPIYVAEINRLYGTSYTIQDAFDIDKSLEMYELMQAAKNPEQDIDKAIYFHNKSESYRRTVLNNLQLIRNYEKIRARVTEK